MRGHKSCVRAALLAVALLAVGCGKDSPVTAPEDPTLPPRSELDGMAIRLTVDVMRGEVTVHTPTISPREATGGRAALAGAGARPTFALVGSSEVSVTRSNFCRSDATLAPDVPECPPEVEPPSGKVRIRFDLALANRLTGVALVTPTFPRPPLGEQGLLLFPFAISRVEDAGDVAASTDWDHGPHNFFNDAVCAAGPGSDCYRYEPYPAPLGPGATSAARTIGFDIDPQVRTFDVDLLLAADLSEGGPSPESGGLGGIVSSPERGQLAGVTVTVTPGGQSGITRAGRGGVRYLIEDVPAGSVTLTLSTLPEGCTDQGPQTATVVAREFTTVNFIVTCTALGRIIGQVTSPERGPLAGVLVTATPGGQTGVTELLTRIGLFYAIENVLAGTFTLTLSTLPEGCTDPEPQTVTVTAGETSVVDFSVTCTALGTIVGTVTSPERGPLAGVTVTVSSVGIVETAVDGGYLVEGVLPGSVTLTLGNLPTGCVDPGSQTATVATGEFTTVDFSVTCSVRGPVVP